MKGGEFGKPGDLIAATIGDLEPAAASSGQDTAAARWPAASLGIASHICSINCLEPKGTFGPQIDAKPDVESIAFHSLLGTTELAKIVRPAFYSRSYEFQAQIEYRYLLRPNLIQY